MIYLTLFLMMMRKPHSSFGSCLDGILERGRIEPLLKARKGYFMA